MEKRKYTLGERLNMVSGQKMVPNCKYHIKKMHDPRHVQAGSREFDSIIVECEEGFYFLPNVIVASVLEEGIEASRHQLEGHVFICRQFESKAFKNKGLTLTEIEE